MPVPEPDRQCPPGAQPDTADGSRQRRCGNFDARPGADGALMQIIRSRVADAPARMISLSSGGTKPLRRRDSRAGSNSWYRPGGRQFGLATLAEAREQKR
ncbi:hypothetical protein GCM10010342_17300 [Streptomyces anulatus]|nr:hypothetical protein GCM10010342_17300 [Streptomyces anulatus]